MEAGLHPQTMTVQGQLLRYTLSVPEGLTAQAPLVLCLHYAGHGSPWYGRGLLAQLAEPTLRPLGAVMIAPDCPGPSWTDPAVVPLVLALMDAIAQRWKTDPGRVVVIGYSMGGMGAWHLAAAQPDRFSAAVPIAGRPSDTLPRIPMFIVHSRRDEVVDIQPDASAAAALSARGVPVVFVPLERPTHYDVQAHADAMGDLVPWLRARWTRP